MRRRRASGALAPTPDSGVGARLRRRLASAVGASVTLIIQQSLSGACVCRRRNPCDTDNPAVWRLLGASALASGSLGASALEAALASLRLRLASATGLEGRASRAPLPLPLPAPPPPTRLEGANRAPLPVPLPAPSPTGPEGRASRAPLPLPLPPPSPTGSFRDTSAAFRLPFPPSAISHLAVREPSRSSDCNIWG